MQQYLPGGAAGELPGRCEQPAAKAIRVAEVFGHTLARVECELILQTLESHQGNRTNSATLLGTSVRCLRNKIRTYKRCGENVPDPQLAFRN